MKTLKGLAGIRDAVWELLTSESLSQNWEAVCRRLLDKPVSFWEGLLQQLFLDRLQVRHSWWLGQAGSSSLQWMSVVRCPAWQSQVQAWGG